MVFVWSTRRRNQKSHPEISTSLEVRFDQNCIFTPPHESTRGRKRWKTVHYHVEIQEERYISTSVNSSSSSRVVVVVVVEVVWVVVVVVLVVAVSSSQ
jgi:hypothetical protein